MKWNGSIVCVSLHRCGLSTWFSRRATRSRPKPLLAQQRYLICLCSCWIPHCLNRSPSLQQLQGLNPPMSRAQVVLMRFSNHELELALSNFSIWNYLTCVFTRWNLLSAMQRLAGISTKKNHSITLFGFWLFLFFTAYVVFSCDRPVSALTAGIIIWLLAFQKERCHFLTYATSSQQLN